MTPVPSAASSVARNAAQPCEATFDAKMHVSRVRALRRAQSYQKFQIIRGSFPHLPVFLRKRPNGKGGGRCNGILSSVRAGLVSRCKIRAVRAINPYPDYGSAYQFYTFRASPMPDSKEPAPKRTNRLLPTQPRAPDWQPPPSVWRFRRGRPENSPSHSPAPRRTRRHRARPSGG